MNIVSWLNAHKKIVAIAISLVASLSIMAFALSQTGTLKAWADNQEGNVWYTNNSEEALEEDMKEVYRYLSHAYNDGIGMHMISELLDPLTFASGGTTDGKQARIIDRLDLNITDNNKNLFEPEWNNFYATILKCNKVINESYNSEEQEIAAKYECEAKTIRSLCYLNLMKLFGPIPMLRDDLDGTQFYQYEEIYSVMQDRKDPGETIKSLIEDLEKARACLPAEKISAHNNHRASSSDVVTVLLAHVYMYAWSQNYYDNSALDRVVEYTDRVIASGYYELLPDYASLWASACARNNVEQGRGSTLDNLLDGYLTGDNDTETIFSITFNDKDLNPESCKWYQNMGLRNMSYQGTGEGQGMLNVSPIFVKEFQSDTSDARTHASIIEAENSGMKWDEKWPTAILDWHECTEFFPGKYTPLCLADGTPANYSQDYKIFRYADIFIMKAFCLAAKGDIQGAFYTLNKLRARAGLSPISMGTIEELYSFIQKETAFEANSYWYYIFFCKVKGWPHSEYIIKYSKDVKVMEAGTPNVNLDAYKPENINNKSFLQIPQDTMLLLGVDWQYWQNPGWVESED